MPKRRRKRKRNNGDGTIFKRRNSYVVRVTINGKPVERHCSSIPEAEAVRIELVALAKTPQLAENHHVSGCVSGLAEPWD